MKVDIYMRLFVGDYLKKTADLDAKESGAYLHLLMGLWVNGGKLAFEPKRLRRIMKLDTQKEFKKVWSTLESYFDFSDGQLSNRRVTEELEYCRKRRAIAKENGKKGGRPKPIGKPMGSSLVNPEKTSSSSTSSSEDKKKKESLFSTFWDGYGRKVEKQEALKIWKAMKVEECEAAVKALPEFIRANPDPKYRKHPHRWLKGKCWEDEQIPTILRSGNQSELERFIGQNSNKGGNDGFVASLPG